MRWAALAALAVLLTGCVSRNPFSYYHPLTAPGQISSLLKRVEEIESQKFENIKMETLVDNGLSSHHLVVIRDQEPLHYHADHDGWAQVLKGEADFLLDQTWMKLEPGSSVYIPRGMRHKALRRGPGALSAFVIFTPSYDGKDIVPVEEK